MSLRELEQAVSRRFGCEVLFIGASTLEESRRGRIADFGLVATFELTGETGAKLCYAWATLNEDGNGVEVTTALRGFDYCSPEIAVREAAIR